MKYESRNNLKNPDLSRVRGFSLVEVLVTVGIMTIIAFGLLQLQTADSIRILSSRQQSSRDTIKMIADRYILDYDIIKKSADKINYTALGNNFAGNEALDYCLNGAPTVPTPQCPVGQHPNCCNTVTNQPFALLEPSNPSIRFSGTEAAGAPLALTTFAPVRYDFNGKVCLTASPDCSLELLTSFSALCSGTPTPANCNRTNEIYVNYSLRGANGITPLGGVPFKPMNPNSPVPIDASAAGGGGAVMQLKCVWIRQFSSQSLNADARCRESGGLQHNLCDPMPCPMGWTEASPGVLSMEITTNWGNGSGGFAGNCIRTCIK